MTTTYRKYTELSGWSTPDVPYRTNIALREIDTDVQTVDMRAQSAIQVSSAAITQAQGATDLTLAQGRALEDQGQRLGTLETLGGLAPGDVSDATMRGILENPGSLSAAQLATMFAAPAAVAQAVNAQRSDSKVQVIYKTDAAGQLYTRARTFNRRPIPNLVRKEFANRAELTKPAGAGFIPVRQDPKSAAAMFGSPFISNASGWKISGTVGEIRGAQIKAGVIYHDFENFDTSPAGVDAIGYKADGTAKLYSSRRGDTAASMLADGVVDSFSYGPILVESGVATNLMADPRWTYFQTEVSARVIIGTDALGDTIVLTTSGISGSVGLTGPQCVALAQAEGMHNAILMDGGGSAQLYTAGTYAQPSSDAGLQRGVPDFFMLNAELMDTDLDTGWLTVPYLSGYTHNAMPLAVRSRAGMITFKGDSKPNGTLPGGATSFGAANATVATIPARFRHGTLTQAFTCPGNGDNLRKVSAGSTGDLMVVGSAANTASYIDFSTVKYAKEN